MPYKPLILLTFFTLLFSLLYIGLKVPQGTGRIFEKNTQKSPPSTSKSRFVYPHLKANAFSFLYSPCKTFFGSCAFLAKPTDKKQSNGSRLGLVSIRAEPLRSFVQKQFLFKKMIRNTWGFDPTRRASTLAKKQRKDLKTRTKPLNKKQQ